MCVCVCVCVCVLRAFQGHIFNQFSLCIHCCFVFVVWRMCVFFNYVCVWGWSGGGGERKIGREGECCCV